MRKSQRLIGVLTLVLLCALASGNTLPARANMPSAGTPSGGSQSTPAATSAASNNTTDPTQPELVGINDDAPVDALAVFSVGTGGQKPGQNCGNDISNPDNQSANVIEIQPDELLFQVEQPAFCSLQDMNQSQPYALSPSGNKIQLADYSFKSGDQKEFALTLPLIAYMQPGNWKLGLNNPATDLLQISVPVASQPFFLRGRGDTSLVGGFKADERVRGVVYKFQGNNDSGKWVYGGTISFQVAANGFRLLTVKNSHDTSFVLIGNQHSFVMANARFNDNDADQQHQDALFNAYWSNSNTSSGNTPPTIKTRTDSRGVEQIWVPAGCFQMGSASPQDISDQIKDQTQREVCLTTGYWIDRYEVSNAEYQKFIDANGYKTRNYWSDAGWQWLQQNNRQGPTDYPDQHLSDPQQPRVGVSLFEAEAYARWRGGSIPTEVQWVFAASGPQSLLYPWGNTFENGRANIRGVAGRTVDVKSYPNGQSWVGAFNMSGNVGEWVSDCYNADYDASNVKNDPVGPCDGSNEMVKGSSWAFNQFPAQVHYRFVNPPQGTWFDVGIRVLSR